MSSRACRLRSLNAYRAREAAWRAAHRDEINAGARRRRRENPQYRASTKAWAAAHQEKVRASGRAWAARNREHMKQYAASWKAANLDRWRLIHRVREQRRRHAGGSFSDQDVRDLLQAQNGRCAYCERSLSIYHVEHKTPVTRGGTNHLDNLCLSCPPCNWRKHTKTEAEFRALLAAESAAMAQV